MRTDGRTDGRIMLDGLMGIDLASDDCARITDAGGISDPARKSGGATASAK